ncbi:hypothetical protein AB0K92_02815 [Streptomyces sp. NPDC052687]|uniref:hypothetical protein n=1 Tax=Streptomyces sp. NPDC052687 TaxID=3154759 RepID=UPI003430F7F4
MTPSSLRGRPRRAASHLPARVAHAVLGAVVAVLWLVLPGTTTDRATPAGPAPSAAAQPTRTEETATADLVLPLLALGTALALGAYGHVRRARRLRTRTTPGGPRPGPAPGAALTDLDERARAALVVADDCVRVSSEELDFAAARADAGAVAPYARAVDAARAELTEALRMRRRYDEGVPAEEAARHQALAGIVGRCAEAGRLLDEAAAGFDRLRALEEAEGFGGALEVAEGRFRELAGRTGAAEAAFADLAPRYSPAARAPVVGYAEQAKDRLVFATTRLNRARQCADRGERDRAVAHLRAAEGAVAQAGILVAAVGRQADLLTRAAELVPAALTGAEAELAGARERAGAEAGVRRERGEAASGVARERAGAVDVPVGELRARVLHADAVLSAVREELTSGPCDPLDLLLRIARVTAPVAAGRAAVLPAAAALVARGAVAAAADYVATHRGAVGAEARTVLTAARDAEETDPLTAEALARQARQLAERDVRARGHPDAAPGTGVSGALLGGVLLGPAPADAPAPSFGGPRTRARRTPRAP